MNKRRRKGGARIKGGEIREKTTKRGGKEMP